MHPNACKNTQQIDRKYKQFVTLTELDQMRAVRETLNSRIVIFYKIRHSRCTPVAASQIAPAAEFFDGVDAQRT